MLKSITVCIFIFGLFLTSAAQDSLSISKISDNYIQTISKKCEKLEERLDKESLKALERMHKEEKKLQKLLAKKDSLEAKRIFGEANERYESWKGKFNQASDKISSMRKLEYNPYLDTLKSTLRFLRENSVISNQKEKLEKINKSLDKLNGIDTKLSQADALKQFLKERRQYLKQQLAKFDLVKKMGKMNKEVYYYAASIKEYKEVLKDPKKIEAKAIELLRKSSAFQKFMEGNSEFSSLFGSFTQGRGSNNVSFAGLQTRANVQLQLTSSGFSGNNSTQFLNQQMQVANQQLAQQKNSIKLPSVEENLGEMPDFKPNPQKTKSFFKRLEYGANIQFGKANNFLPSSGEIAATVGYKLNDKGIIGVGLAYKLGLGTGFNHIKFSNQGVGFRSYIDWKIKSGFYISGGYEKNYLPQLDTVVVNGRKLETWQESGLIGISKKYQMGKKKKGYVQLLFDFLSYKNIPRSQPIVFRTGLNF